MSRLRSTSQKTAGEDRHVVYLRARRSASLHRRILFAISWFPDSIYCALKQKSHARKIAWLKFPLPSAALPASGSRGSIGISPRSSQPGGSPAVSRLSPARAKSTRLERDLREQSRQIRVMLAAKFVGAATAVAAGARSLVALISL
jgi:hypothetical protein